MSLTIVAAASSGVAKTGSQGTVAIRSGDLVVFRGTSLQCLAFGPRTQIKGKSGILCFKGPRRQHKLGTWWALVTRASIHAGTADSDAFRAATSGTTIRRTLTIVLNDSVVFAGSGIGCWFRTSEAGEKGVMCGESRGARPRPASEGFLLTERILATVVFAPNGWVQKINRLWRHEK